MTADNGQETEQRATIPHKPGAQAVSQVAITGRDSPLRLFWGDLHNHNAVGYAKGSLSRSIDLAREHLDFFAFTGHAAWHDMPAMPGDRHLKWVHGFETHTRNWSETKRLIREANSADFVTFPGYEWHSSQFGDYCIIADSDELDLYLPIHVERLLDFAEQQGHLAIPHHVGYLQGWRGANWEHFRSATSPVVEIFSEHGCTESDRAPFPMLRHSNGGRSTANTIERQIKQGRRFGFVASTDNHLGYPGAHGEGVLGVWADELTRESLFSAIFARRTYAATGDRIALEVTLNGRPMGSELPFADEREIHVRVEGQDGIASIELVRNGRVIERHFPVDSAPTSAQLPGRVKCRLQYGWGPWGALDLGRVCDWDLTIKVEDGRLLRALPCFQSAPFDEDRRDRLELLSDRELRLRSATTRVNCYAEDPTKSVVLEFEGSADTRLVVNLSQPCEQSTTLRLGDLVDSNHVSFTGTFTSESLIVGRLLGPAEYTAQVRWTDRRSTADGPDFYYVRVTQHNGHMAWSSPIWVG